MHRCLMKRNIPERLIGLVNATYENIRTMLRTRYGQAEPTLERSGAAPFVKVIDDFNVKKPTVTNKL